MDKRKNFPSKPYQEFLERERVANDIVDFVAEKYKMSAFEFIAILEIAKNKGLTRCTL